MCAKITDVTVRGAEVMMKKKVCPPVGSYKYCTADSCKE